MKRELKHFAPYLPYGLKFINKTIYGKTIVEMNTYNILNLLVDSKPILRPLSNLTKDEYSHLLYGNPLEYKINELPYKPFIKLLENHFDVFHLIPQGLAIDINT